MKYIKIREHTVSLWLTSILVISLVSVTALAYHLWRTAVIPIEVKEPIEILHYPSKLDLFPGEIKEFSILVQNHATVNYSVEFEFSLSNNTYQDNYVTFSNRVYTVIPGQQNLSAWIATELHAIPTNTSLSANIRRWGALVITDLHFPTSRIRITVNNLGSSAATVTKCWVNGVEQTITTFTLNGNSQYLLNMTYSWTQGNSYEVKLASSSGYNFSRSETAPLS